MKLARIVVTMVLIGAGLTLAAPSAPALPAGFQITNPIIGLSTPTALRFASDGRVFIAEKSGLIKVWDSIDDPTASIFADLSTNVYSYVDLGLMGLELHPNFPATPYVYALYTYDAEIGATAPRWGTPGVLSDPCPDPPGGLTDGCIHSGRLSRLTADGNQMTGPEQVLVEDWCGQFPSHTIGTVTFGPDGALYAGGGEGAKTMDWGQFGSPRNPCGDPPGGVGASLTPPTAEGGSLRSQDLRTSGDPVGLDGTIIRIDPLTGEGLPDNPMAGSLDANARRVITYGLRNPFRFAFRPGTEEIFIGDVGQNTWEEINVIPDANDSTVENFGWPCYEGNPRLNAWDSRDFNICEGLYAQPGAARPTFFDYQHGNTLFTGDTCNPGGGVISAIGFYPGGSYPDAYDGALFFGDYARNCMWTMFRNQNGVIDPNTIQTFQNNAGYPVDFQVGPGGDMYFLDVGMGRLRRISYTSSNQPPTADISADATYGPLPLTVNFDGSGSSDPEGGPLTYAWDLDGDGEFDDASTAQASHTYTSAGGVSVRLRVTDPDGAQATDLIVISAGNSPPVATIGSPAADFTYHVGEQVDFSGSATDPDDGSLGAAALSWDVILHHCPSTCHEHFVQSFVGQESGSFPASDHEYPSHLEIRLTATDSSGLTDTESLLLYPETTTLNVAASPTGLQVSLNSETLPAPYSRTVVVGSSNALTAPSPQSLAGTAYQFASWSDGGAQTHQVTAGTTPATYTATYEVSASFNVAILDSGYNPRDLTVALGQNVRWTNQGTRVHTVTDNSGMGLYDSGPLSTGSSFAFTYFGSGRYPIRSSGDPGSFNASVTVPMSLSPTTGTPTTSFNVTWASAPPPPGYVFDIQRQRPGQNSFNNWRTSQTVTGVSFVPDFGVGTYSFRARLRNSATGRAGAFTAGQSIIVSPANQPPTASIAASPTSGSAPLTVSFDGTGSTDPENGALSYAWDLDGDGQFDDATTDQVVHTYQTPGDVTAGLRVTDPQGAQDTESVVISAGNTPPVASITAPESSLTWRVGETIDFAGEAADPEDGSLADTALSWEAILNHCPSACHTHPIGTFAGVGTGSFVAPDHEYPATIELRLTATDSNGQSVTTSVTIQPETTSISLATNPSGLVLGLNSEQAATPFSRTAIVGSTNTLTAPSPQMFGGLTYDFGSWSDAGARVHTITAGTSPASFTASYAVSSMIDISITDSGYSPRDVTITTGQTVRWTNNGSLNHTATDNAGMGLFDSGVLTPGSSYSFTFTGAGRYPVRSTLDSNFTGSVTVLLTLAPPSGTTSTSFTITWASAAPPSNYVYDIQIQRPGSSTWNNWRINQTATGAAFIPDAGPGTYSFRARMRNFAIARASAYTAGQSITVTSGV